MAIEEVLAAVGIKVQALFAGLSGGFVKALVSKSTPGTTVANIVIGGLTANYLGDVLASQLSNFLSAEKLPYGAVCFVTGLLAMIIVEKLIARAKRWEDDKGASNA